MNNCLKLYDIEKNKFDLVQILKKDGYYVYLQGKIINTLIKEKIYFIQCHDYSDNRKMWFNKSGELHNIKSFAYECYNSKIYYKNGVLHNLFGSVYENELRDKEYWIMGEKYYNCISYIKAVIKYKKENNE